MRLVPFFCQRKKGGNAKAALSIGDIYGFGVSNRNGEVLKIAGGRVPADQAAAGLVCPG